MNSSDPHVTSQAPPAGNAQPTDRARSADPDGGSTLSLRPPAHRVDKRAIWWWMLQSLAYGLPVVAIALATHWLWDASQPWGLIIAVVVGALIVVDVAVEPFVRYRVHRWETTPDAVYARSGWLVREWRAAPLSRVQTVDAVRGPLEQLLGLSTLRVTTASSYGAIDIGGLDHRTAARLAEELTQITQQIPGDAT